MILESDSEDSSIFIIDIGFNLELWVKLISKLQNFHKTKNIEIFINPQNWYQQTLMNPQYLLSAKK